MEKVGKWKTNPQDQGFVNQNDESAQKVHMYDFKGNYIKSFGSKRRLKGRGLKDLDQR